MKFKYLFQWLRPKTATEAATTKKRLAMVYGFMGWNSFIYFFYLVFTKDKPTDPVERKALLLSKMSKDQKCYTVHLDGLTLAPSGINVQGKQLASPSSRADAMGE